jgi:hypothetical protein
MRRRFSVPGLTLAAVVCAAAVIGVTSCSGTPSQPPLALTTDEPLRDAGPLDATLVTDAQAPTDASDASTADVVRPLDGATDAGPDAPGSCAIVGAAPTTCTPAHVTCTGEILHPAEGRWQGACSVGTINGFWSSCLAGSPAACAAFKASLVDAGAASCLSCLVTPETAPQWGALVAATNGMLSPDLGGCGHYPTGANAGQRSQMTYDECLRVACAAGCTGDPADPAAQGAFTACQDAASKDPASCAQYAGDQVPLNTWCQGGTDFASSAYATMLDFCAAQSECLPLESAPLFPVPNLPQPIHQGVCSPGQIDGFLTACDQDLDAATGATCEGFVSEAGACGACLRTTNTADAGPWGVTTYTPVVDEWTVNITGCLIAAAGGDAAAPCAHEVWQHTACDSYQCAAGDGTCSGLIAPFGPCPQAADNSSCAEVADAAAACVRELLDAGGDPAACVSGTTVVESIRSIATVFCGP